MCTLSAVVELFANIYNYKVQTTNDKDWRKNMCILQKLYCTSDISDRKMYLLQ